MESAARGDVVLVAGGVYASKPHPAVVVQDDLFQGTESLTVCPCTTTIADAPLLRLHIQADDENGLDTDCFVMIDKITTVRRSSVKEHMGHLDSIKMLELERRLLVFLGLAH